MTRIIRAALTQTASVFADMPASVDDLGTLAERLDPLREANLIHHRKLVAAAQKAGAQVLCMGELFSAPYFALTEDPMWRALAEDAASGPTVTAMREAAREHQMIIVAPIYEQDPSGPRFNTAVIIDERGEVLGKYRKTHIPSGENEQGSFHEKFYYDASDGKLDPGPALAAQAKNPFFPVFETRLCRVGVAICYDRHFPGVMKSLAEGGAQLVFCPAVTFGEKSHRMWELEFAVDAARHNLFIGGSNRVGSEAPWNQAYFGASHFVGPSGKLDALDAPANLVISDLDLDDLDTADPSGWNFARDRRSDIY